MMWRRVAFFLILIWLSASIAGGQENAKASFIAEKTTPLIGEPVHLTLQVEVPHQSIVQMPQIPANWGSFEVREIELSETTSQDGNDIYQQIYTVILWKAGDARTPETVVGYQPLSSQQIIQLTVEPAFFSVPSTLTDADKSLRPSRPPILMPYIPLWVIAGIVLFVAVVGFWLVHFVSARRRLLLLAAEQKSDLHVAAQQALNDLRRIAGQSASPIWIYGQSVDCLRIYIQGRFKVDASDMTTSEIIDNLKIREGATQREWDELQRLLERADLVKFARMEPQLESARQYAKLATQWIGRIERVVEAKKL